MSSQNNGDQQADAHGLGSQQNTTSGSSSWSMPSDRCPPSIDRVAAREEASDPTFNPHDEVTSQLQDNLEQILSSSAQEETEATTQRKRKRGERGGNKWPDDTYSVTVVGPKGEPLEPIKVRAKFRNAIGFLVRDMLDITIQSWDLVPLETRKNLWKKLKTKFIFTPQSRAIAKQYAMRQFGISFRGYRSELTTRYVRKGLNPLKKYKKISETQWKIFVEQKTSDEFLAKSMANSVTSKKNIYSHHLGTGGYYGKIPKWKAEDDSRQAAKLPPRFEHVEPRTRQWLLARKPTESGPGCFTWPDPKTDEAAKNILAVVAKQKVGSFKPSRERDALTVGLGNPEHPGRVRGLSSRLGWKEGFPDYGHMYRKRDRYKEAMRDYFREEAKQEMSQMLVELMANPDSELRQQLASYIMSTQQVPTMQQPQMITPPPEMQMATVDALGPLAPCTIGSTANKEHYAVDNITGPSACSIFISYGIANTRMIQVANGFAIPGRMFHNNPIPNDYAKVQVVSVVEGHSDVWLDFPTEEGIEKLGQAINEFILWPRRDIKLVDSAIPSIPTFRLGDIALSHACSSPPLQNHPSSQNAAILTPNPTFIRDIPSHNTPPALAPNQSQSFILNPASDLLSNPPTPLSLEDPPLPSQKGTLSEHTGAEDEQASEPKMKGSPLDMMKWLSIFSRKEGRQESASSVSEKTKRHVMEKDCENVPKEYVPGRPLLERYELSCVPRGMKRLHDWYMRAALVEINIAVPPFIFSDGPLKIPVDFEDIWFMFRLNKLKLQLMRVWCLIQISAQEMWFAEEPLRKNIMVGYLDPFAISQEAHTVVMGDDDNLFVGKTEDEIATIRVEQQENQEFKVATYISNMFLEFQDRRVVCAPYFFNGHWICMYIYLYEARVLVLDSADFPRGSYEKFIEILNKAYMLYKKKGGQYNLKKQKNLLHVRTNAECHKQEPGSNHCGYYVCEFLRHDGRYAQAKKVYKCADPTNNRLSDVELMDICDEISWFILKEVISKGGKYFEADGELGEPEFQDIIELNDDD